MMATLFVDESAPDLGKDDRPMMTTFHPTRWTRLFMIAVPIALGGCGGGESPETSNPQVVTRDASTTDQPVAIESPELTATKDRAMIDASAARVEHAVDQTSGAVTQAVGDAETQAKQAAGDAVNSVKGLAAELRDDAKQTVDGAKTDARRRLSAAGHTTLDQAEKAEAGVINNVLGPAPKD